MSTMSCVEFERLLDEAIETRTVVDGDLLERHAAACASCRSMWDQARLLDQAIVAWRGMRRKPTWPTPCWHAGRSATRTTSATSMILRLSSTSIETSILFHGAQPVQPPARFTARHMTTGVMAVATIALLIFSWQRFQIWRADKNTPLVEGQMIVTTDVPGDTDDNDAEFDMLLQHASSAYRVLAVDAAAAVADGSKLVVATNRRTPPESRAETAVNHRVNAKAKKGLGRGLKPIGRQFGEALDFLFDVATEPPPSI